MTSRYIPQLSFSFYRHRTIRADFSGGQTTSDAGLLPLRALDQRHGLSRGLAECICDDRDDTRVSHPGLTYGRWSFARRQSIPKHNILRSPRMNHMGIAERELGPLGIGRAPFGGIAPTRLVVGGSCYGNHRTDNQQIGNELFTAGLSDPALRLHSRSGSIWVR